MSKKKLKDKFIDNFYLGIASIIVGAILLCVYYIHGVYPFGERSISYYDMSQSYVPLYYHTWDVLHGIKNVFFDWNLGMGCSITDVAGSFILFPSNLFFFIVSRDKILFSLSYFLMLKMMLSAFSMSFYISASCKNKIIVIYAGIAYAFCGFVLQYYTNIYYLDVVMIFPLLVWSMNRLIIAEKKTAYIILLSLCFLANQQLAFTVVIYIILKGFLEIQRIDIQSRGSSTMRLVISSIAGFILSAFSFIPSFLVMSHSSRYSNATSVGIIELLLSLSCDFFEQKMFMLYSTEIGIGCIAYLLLNRDRLKKYYSELIIIVLLAIPIVFENVNLLWHGGSYQHFPMRFGYMLAFEVLQLICKVVNDKEYIAVEQAMKDEESINPKRYNITGTMSIISIILIISMTLMLAVLSVAFRTYGIRDLTAYHGYGFVIIVTAIIGLVVCLIRNERIIGFLLLTIAIIQGSIGSYSFIAPESSYSVECGDQFVRISEQVFANIQKTDATNRIKDKNLELNSNYGFILRQSSMGCWMNGMGFNMQNAMYRMGYTINYTRVLDGGGSIFTDALLGVNRLYSKDIVNESLYSNGYPAGIGNIYDCLYTLPFGVLMNATPEGEGFEYQNSLFDCITGEEGLFELIDIGKLSQQYEYDSENGINMFVCNIPVEAESTLYIYGNIENGIASNYAFEVNGELIPMDALGTDGNYLYPTFFMNGLVEAGTYKNENIEFAVITSLEDINDIHVGLLRNEVLRTGIAKVKKEISSKAMEEKGKLIIESELARGGSLFLPIGYSDNYRLIVDNAITEYFPVLEGAFVGINIEKGEHTIEVIYIPKGLKLGMFMTLIGIAITLCLVFGKNVELSAAGNAFWDKTYQMVFFFVIMILYMIPMMVGVAVRIYQLLSIGDL